MLLAAGDSKAPAVAATIEGPVTSMITASALQLHRDVLVYVDRAATRDLKMADYYHWIQAKSPGAPAQIRPPHFRAAARRLDV